MKLSMNVETLLKKHDIGYCINIYQNAGFTAVDYPLCNMVKDEDVFNRDDYKTAAEAIRRVADEKGMPINQTHAPFSFSKQIYENPVTFEEIVIPRSIRALEISAILGAKISVVHPLHYMTYAGNEEELFARNMAYYRRLLPYAKEFGVKIGVENMFQRDPRRKCLTADTCSFAKEFVRYIDTLDDPFAVACLDVGHVGLPANATEEAWDVIRALGHDRLQALHIHDNDYVNDQHMPPFMGKLNWGEITRALGEIDYAGDFTFEVSSGLISSYNEDYLPIVAKFMAETGKYLVGKIEANR